MMFEADGIGGERPTGKSRRFDRALALDRSSNLYENSIYKILITFGLNDDPLSS
jgi:hypothetical protein